MKDHEEDAGIKFVDIEDEIEAYWPSTTGGVLSRTEKYSLTGALFGAGLTLAALAIQKYGWTFYIALLGMAIELVSISIWLRYFVKNDLPSIRRVGPDLAKSLDAAYPRFVDLMRRLRDIPKPVLAERLEFLRHRVEVSQQRMGLLTGSFEKLGVLPALAGVALQLKAILAEGSKNASAGYIFGSLVIGVYLLCLLASRIRLRQSFYLNVLESALDMRGR